IGCMYPSQLWNYHSVLEGLMISLWSTAICKGPTLNWRERPLSAGRKRHYVSREEPARVQSLRVSRLREPFHHRLRGPLRDLEENSRSEESRPSITILPAIALRRTYPRVKIPRDYEDLEEQIEG